MDFRKALGLETEEVEENTVNYELFFTDDEGNLTGISPEKARGLQLQLLEHTLPFVEGYVWQRGHWDLHLGAICTPPWANLPSKKQKKKKEPATASCGSEAGGTCPHLWGSVPFGDNVEDEWFIVWLLLELTKKFRVTARVWDNDGEFLLIEAAYSLPRWLKPEAATNRVWLHGGTLHIVPLPTVAGDPQLPPRPTTLQALALVGGRVVDTRASSRIMAHIAQRVEGFPGKALELMHRTRVVVPSRLAHVLRREPQLIAPAVEAFHYRDRDDMRDLLPLRATFSQCLYAQLALQEFHPVRTYPMPLPSDPQFKAAEAGMKLAAGFEMLAAADAPPKPCCAAAATAYAADDPPRQVATEVQALEADPCWQAYCAAVQAEGAPPGPSQQQGSQGAGDAVRRYRQVQAYRRRAADLTSPVDALHRVMQEPPLPPESYPPLEALPPDDPEAWLREGGAELEGELSRRQQEMEQGQGRKGGAHRPPQGDAEFDPEALATQLRRFMDMTAGLEGAEVPAALGTGSAPGTTFDEGKFASELERVLGLDTGPLGAGRGDARDDDDDVTSESSEEGSSFYTGDTSSEEEEEQELGWEAEETGRGRPAPGTHRPFRPGPPSGSPAGSSAPVNGGLGMLHTAVVEGAGVLAARAALQERWEVGTATDSDDDVGAAEGGQAQHAQRDRRRHPTHPAEGAVDGSKGEEEGGEEEDLGEFMDAYSRAMQAELAPTTLGRSFLRAQQQAPSPAAGQAGAHGELQAVDTSPGGDGAGEGRDAPSGSAQGEDVEVEGGQEMEPLDMDLNVVEGLLASFHQQQGLPGPASNLAGLLGIRLPPPQPPAKPRQ